MELPQSFVTLWNNAGTVCLCGFPGVVIWGLTLGGGGGGLGFFATATGTGAGLGSVTIGLAALMSKLDVIPGFLVTGFTA